MRSLLLFCLLAACLAPVPLTATHWQGWTAAFIPTWDAGPVKLTTYAELRMTNDLSEREIAILSEKIRFPTFAPAWGPALNLTYLEINRGAAPGISHFRVEPEINPVLLTRGPWQLDGRARLELRHIKNTSGLNLRQRLKLRTTWMTPDDGLPFRSLSAHIEGFYVYRADRWTEVRSVPLELAWSLPGDHRLATFFMIQSRYRGGSWQHDPTLGLKAFLRF